MEGFTHNKKVFSYGLRNPILNSLIKYGREEHFLFVRLSLRYVLTFTDIPSSWLVTQMPMMWMMLPALTDVHFCLIGHNNDDGMLYFVVDVVFVPNTCADDCWAIVVIGFSDNIVQMPICSPSTFSL